MAVTYDGTAPGGSGTVTHYKMYIDGVEDTNVLIEVTTPDHIAGFNMYIGSSGPTDTTDANIYISDVAIWDDDLSSGDVTTLYNNGRPLDLSSGAPDSSDFIAWYRFDEFSGDNSISVPNRAPSPAASTDGSGSVAPYQPIVMTRFSPNSVDGLNILLNNRAGRFGWPTWKQIRTGETKVATKLRRTNKIGTVLVPGIVPQASSPGRTYQYVRGKQANTFADYTEQPISSRYKPTMVCLEDNTEEANVANNLSLNIAYGNMLDHFSNQGLNNRLNVPVPNLYNNALNTVFEYVTGSNLTAIVDYSERLYPAATNVYKNIIRRRTSYSIDNIWNGNRNSRSTIYGGNSNSQGTNPGASYQFTASSIWPLDGHLDFATTSSVQAADGAGELMNSYSRFYADQNIAGLTLFPAATYASRILINCTSSGTIIKARAGDTKWLTAEQSGKSPYESYDSYSHRMVLAAKDHSIIPEFRISSLMERYVESSEGDFLIDVDNIFEITGATIADSSEANFYRTYSNSDFLKYFSVVDESLNNKRAGDLKINRDRISLQCSAYLKFLPYKGFYPAERTVELASLFSQSYGPIMVYNNSMSPLRSQQAFRAVLEPMYAPGIMYNTIKSGIAVSNFIIVNTSASYSSYFIPSSSTPTQRNPLP